MMKILILDDEFVRHDGLKASYGGDANEFTHAFTTSAVIYALQNESFDMMTLDHDLGSYTYLSPEDEEYERLTPIGSTELILVERNGSTLVEQIVNEIDWSVRKRPFVVIHSHNPDGAKRMYQVLKSDGFNVILHPF